MYSKSVSRDGVLETQDPAVDAVSPTPRDPPGPRRLPLFGNLRELRANPLAFHARLANEYGGVVRYWYGRSPTYLVAGPDVAKEMLVDNRDKQIKVTRYPQLRRAIGDGLVLSEGAVWKRQRVITQLGYKPSRLEAQLDQMGAEVAAHLESWHDRAEQGSTFDLYLDMIRITQRLSGILLVGARYADYAERWFEITERVRRNWPDPPKGLLGSFRPPPIAKILALRGAMQELDEVAYEIIRSRHRVPESEGGVLEILHRESTRQGTPFTDQELRDQIVTLFYAGYETTASSLTWAQYLLATHPEVQDKLVDEVHRTAPAGVPGVAELAKLGYTEQVLQETMRLYAPIHCVGRQTTEDIVVGGYRIPKDSHVIVSFYATHRLPQWWPDPERFDPDRFTAEQVAGRHRYAYMPFSAGNRYCIGAVLAMLEGKQILAMIAQRYRLRMKPKHPVEAICTSTVHPRNGLPMTVERA